MIDIKVIREEPDRVKKACADKGMTVDIDHLLSIDARRRELETEFNELRHQQRQAGEKIAKAPKEEKAVLSKEMGPIRDRIKAVEEERASVDAELHELMLRVPQVPHDDAPVGHGDESNVELRKVGEPRRKGDFGFEFKDHLALGESLGLFDFERGVKLAGSRNYVLCGAGAMLHEAVLRLAWDIMLRRDFVPLTVPVLVNERLMVGTGFFPLHRDEVYLAERDNQCLVGTAEVPVTGLHCDEILSEDELPKLYVARSTCFRREAGAAGRDTRGLYRVHFMDKLEQVVLCKADPEESAKWHEIILLNSEDVLQALELPYRVVEVCTGEMGQGKYRMYDIETWMPSRESYSETHSASSFHDFQARRLNLRYRTSPPVAAAGSRTAGKTGRKVKSEIHFCHTLNNTVIASPRILIPLVETNQNADGSVSIPQALRPYMQGMERIEAPAS
ncbi:MAG: serine--tRNA ligase [Planctomycetes bacterium]|nr:serine--tRNA ligase [Planctomycetota bacterium]